MLGNSSMDSIVEQSGKTADQVISDSLNSNESQIQVCAGKQHKVISARQMAEIVEKADDKVLILDCRSFIEFNTSHIRNATNVCCSKLMKRRLQQDKMSVHDLLLQSCRVDSEGLGTILVYDQNTEQPAKLPADSFLVILMSKLLATFNTVYFLRGGFLHFQAHYSHLIEAISPILPLIASVSQPQSHSADSPPTRVLSFLYLGSQVDAMNKDFIESRRITHVLNVSTHCPQSPYVSDCNFFRIPINDTYNEKIVPHLGEAFKFLDKVRESGGCVLVHCLAGISRSPTLAIAYLMQSLRLSYEEAYQYVRERRPAIAPNFNFLGQLLDYEKSINENRHRRHKRQQSLSSIPAAAANKPTSVFIPSERVSSTDSPAEFVKKLQQQRVVQFLRPHASNISKRPSLTGLSEIAQAASAREVKDGGLANVTLSMIDDSTDISEKCPRLDSPTSAMARLSFDRSISVEVRLPIHGNDRPGSQKKEKVASVSFGLDCSECNTPRGTSQDHSMNSSSLAALLAKAATTKLNSLPLRACVVDPRLSSALSSAEHRALTCAAVGGASGVSMSSFDNLLVTSLNASPACDCSQNDTGNCTSAETVAAWRKTRSLDNMAMLDPLIESPDRVSGSIISPTGGHTATAPNAMAYSTSPFDHHHHHFHYHHHHPTQAGASSNHSGASSAGASSGSNNNNNLWAVRAASASLAEQPSNNGKNNGGGTGGLLCGSGTVSPASSSLSIHSVCSSTTEIAA